MTITAREILSAIHVNADADTQIVSFQDAYGDDNAIQLDGRAFQRGVSVHNDARRARRSWGMTIEAVDTPEQCGILRGRPDE